MDKVPGQLVDEITGIEYTKYEDRFIPGIDVLAGGIVGAGIIFVIGRLIRKPTKK
ncbi:MAG: hypothetical protein J6386_08655 [Candidatus Synoicihabitans palmerolidicus]|nr:hypothetical protein [Candidatus Synoicihabitans palmerolidicus]